jgi:hypothetical protein
VIHARAASFINDDHPEKYLDLAVAQTLPVFKLKFETPITQKQRF